MSARPSLGGERVAPCEPNFDEGGYSPIKMKRTFETVTEAAKFLFGTSPENGGYTKKQLAHIKNNPGKHFTSVADIPNNLSDIVLNQKDDNKA